MFSSDLQHSFYVKLIQFFHIRIKGNIVRVPLLVCTRVHRDSQKLWHGSSATGYYSHLQGFPRFFAITQRQSLGANQWGSLQQLCCSHLQGIRCYLWRKTCVLSLETQSWFHHRAFFFNENYQCFRVKSLRWKLLFDNFYWIIFKNKLIFLE